MKRDISIALAAILVVLGVTFALAKTRPDKPLTPSKPFVPAKEAAGAAGKATGEGRVVMRVNGEPVTEREFTAFMAAVPEQQRAMFASPEGRRLLATEVVRMKALEQEGVRLGLANDPQLLAQMDLLRSQVMAQRALEKVVGEKAESLVRAEYDKVKNDAKTLRHIVVGFEGSMIPPRDRKPLSPEAAMAKANALIAKLRGGADFGQIARTESDDLETGSKGGTLGPLSSGQLPPEIEAVVSKLQPGQVSEPVRTQLGLHIFSLGTPTLEDMRPMLLQRVQQQVAQEEVKRLEAQAKVDLDPTYFPPQPPTATPQQSAPAPTPRPNG